MELENRRSAGRRTGDSGTRAAILAAAREQFAGKGYDGASLRVIAAAAGVDTGLIRHFYGSKDDLFDAALQIPQEIAHRMGQVFTGDPDHYGARLVEAYLSLWEDPASSGALLAIVRSAIASDRAADRLQAILGARFLADISPHLDDTDGHTRAALAGAHLLGVAIARYVVHASPVADMDRDALVAWCAPTVQRYLTAPPPAPA
ncbi:TetR family transcriptional regulator [Micromonospora sp. RTGN7]|uniref:TetR/AcrR family transcriptional regulator n=1 Tax=Micromonospora sp. RTGN7 TaxID=3016526 RepID=UPI0029FF4881|nr:TetR family transcriptional regulator [Micromonospora sp. RTGN7]